MLFVYRAFKDAKIVKKQIDANSKKDVVDYLRYNNYFPIEIKAKDDKLKTSLLVMFDRVSFTDIVDFTRQLAIMLNAGLTLIDAFDIMKKQITKESLLKVIDSLDKDVRAGQSFSSALKKYRYHFSDLYISLVRSGEASGKLSEILLKLAENMEKEREFRGKIQGAMIYPIIIIVGMVSVMFIMVTFVVPKLLDLYKDFNIELPITTQILILVSSFFSRYWPLIIVGAIGIFTFLRAYLSTKKGKLVLDKFVLKIPVISKVVRISSLVDSTRTISILIGSGVSLLDALEIVIDTTSNMVFQQAFNSVYKQVEKGISLGSSMANEGVFPPILVQMTTVGEQTGHLDETLGRISRYFEMESELAIKTMTTLIEPLILVVLGLGVGFLVMSVITPIYNLTTSFK